MRFSDYPIYVIDAHDEVNETVKYHARDYRSDVVPCMIRPRNEFPVHPMILSAVSEKEMAVRYRQCRY